jgi:hypothetical protein
LSPNEIIDFFFNLLNYSKEHHIRLKEKGLEAITQGLVCLVKHENGHLFAGCHTILSRRKNFFSQLLNVNNVCDVRQIEVHMAEPLVPYYSFLVVEIAIAKMKSINHQVVIKF